MSDEGNRLTGTGLERATGRRVRVEEASRGRGRANPPGADGRPGRPARTSRPGWGRARPRCPASRAARRAPSGAASTTADRYSCSTRVAGIVVRAPAPAPSRPARGRRPPSARPPPPTRRRRRRPANTAPRRSVDPASMPSSPGIGQTVEHGADLEEAEIALAPLGVVDQGAQQARDHRRAQEPLGLDQGVGDLDVGRREAGGHLVGLGHEGRPSTPRWPRARRGRPSGAGAPAGSR